MPIFYFFDFVVIVFLIHQLVIPLIRGLPVFPLFRDKPLEDELVELNQQVKEKAVKEKISNVKQSLKGKK